jgi:alpha-tubulin suppressor-like RCC1 family protein
MLFAALVQVGTASTWTSVAAGSSQTAAARRDGTLWAWGLGQLGGTPSNLPAIVH